MARERAKASSLIGSIFTGAWTYANLAISIANLPADASAALKTLVSVPAFIPIGLTIICLSVLAWAIFWPSETVETEQSSVGQRDSTHGEGSHILSGTFHDTTINFAPAERPKPATSLTVLGRLIPYEYEDGIERVGIIWRSGYAHVQLQFLNNSETAFENVSVTIELDFPIVKGSAISSLTDVRLNPTFTFDLPIMLGVSVEDGQTRVCASDSPSDMNQSLDPSYRLFCANMPAKSDIRVDLAIAQAAPIDSAGDIFLPVRPIPTEVLLESAYTAYGEIRREQQKIVL
ncbi:MAG: hypothetical protein JHD32_13830 [Sphingobium sp.]|nr:hypothetical protein [Sphingobium sp.]